MILFDPDLEADPSSHVKVPRRSESSARTPARNQRIPAPRTLAAFLREAQSAVRLRGQVTVLLTTNTAIRRLNQQFRGKNKATDVLSFPASAPGHFKIAGDLAISIPTAQRQAHELHHSLAIEIKVLMLHGLLHLAGYDHETDKGEMALREQKLRAKLRLPQGLIERTMSSATRSDGGRATTLSAPSSLQLHRGDGAKARTPKGRRP
ncbi:rRNA maturation RNase YbeY [Telmatobacter sp. DSM 110680]|uniref:Endoribonuclease YbeY n=1 Tax=Telmatobacter sp. DSM 110680 TaxID=3036704 RepID=A0AAU7DQ39_9BACT